MNVLWRTYYTEPLSTSSSVVTIVVALTSKMYELTGEPGAQSKLPSPGTLSISFATATEGFGLWGDKGTSMKKPQLPTRNDDTAQRSQAGFWQRHQELLLAVALLQPTLFKGEIQLHMVLNFLEIQFEPLSCQFNCPAVDAAILSACKSPCHSGYHVKYF